MYVAIVSIDQNGKVTKYKDGFDTLEAAQSHVDANNGVMTLTKPVFSRESWRVVSGQLVSDLPIAPVPQRITPLQARKALRHFGILDAINSWVATQSAEIQDEWEYAVVIERDNATIAAAASADPFNLTSEEVDAIFIYGATQ